MFSFNLQKADTSEPLGGGASGEVFTYGDDAKWVVKRIIATNTKAFIKSIQEIVLSFSCDHPNIIPAKGYHIDYNEVEKIWKVYIKFPRMQKSLTAKFQEYIASNKPISNGEIVNYFYSLVCGLEYLHKKGIAHRDIKPDNILIDYDGKIKIGDIGIGKFVLEEMSYLVGDTAGTKLYSAPEILDGSADLKKKELFKADVWSLGIVMAELCALKNHLIEVKTSGSVKEQKLADVLASQQGNYDKVILDLILDLVRSEPAKRPTVADIKRILENSYPEILGVPAGSQSLEQRWGEFFTFTFKEKKALEIMVKPGEWNDIILKGMMDDLMKAKAADHHKSFESLAFSFEKNNHFTAQTFQRVAAQIGTLSNLSNLDLNFKGCNQINDDLLKKQIVEISNIGGLQNLSLDYSGCFKITDEGAYDLVKRTEFFLKKLQGLHLNFTNCSKITNKTLQGIVETIGPKHPDLRDLKLDFTDCFKLSEAGVKQLASHMGSKLNKLESFAINLGGCNQINESALKDLTSTIGSKLKELRRVALNLSLSNLTSQAVQDLSIQMGKNLKNLTYLSLDFSVCNKVKDEGIIELAGQIGSNLKNLESLTLDFSSSYEKTERCSITDKGMGELIKQLGQNSKNLKTLNLYCACCLNITDQSIKELSMQLGANLKSLQNLGLNFSGNRSLSDDAIKFLATQLGANLNALETFYLNLKACGFISASSIKELTAQFAMNLPNLHNLRMDLRSCIGVTDEAVQDFAAKIPHRKMGLKHLILALSGFIIMSQSYKQC